MKSMDNDHHFSRFEVSHPCTPRGCQLGWEVMNMAKNWSAESLLVWQKKLFLLLDLIGFLKLLNLGLIHKQLEKWAMHRIYLPKCSGSVSQFSKSYSNNEIKISVQFKPHSFYQETTGHIDVSWCFLYPSVCNWEWLWIYSAQITVQCTGLFSSGTYYILDETRQSTVNFSRSMHQIETFWLD